MPKENKESDERKTEANPMIKMCFPRREQSGQIVYCVCHNEPKFIYYKCLVCQAPQCEISAACKVCKVMLVSAVHLARTKQHEKEVVPKYERIKDYIVIQ